MGSIDSRETSQGLTHNPGKPFGTCMFVLHIRARSMLLVCTYMPSTFRNVHSQSAYTLSAQVR